MILFNFLKYFIEYIRYNSILQKVYRDENVMDNLGKTLEVEFKKDWIGRLYCIFNPNLKNGVFDPNNPIYSYNERGLNTDEFVKQYIMTKLNVAQQYIHAQNLFDLVTYELKQLDEYNNFLFIIMPLPYKNFVKYLKLLPISLMIILAIIITLIIIF